MIGYRTIDPASLLASPRPGLQRGHSGLEAQGRGTWHQLDALCDWDHSPAFIYPLRLIVEAKCYKASAPIQVSVVRSALGVLTDVSENYFTFAVPDGTVQGPRYNYVSAIFSTSGFTKGAVEFAVAHQIFLIQYEDVPAIAPVIDAIRALDEEHFVSLEKGAISESRTLLRAELQNAPPPEPGALKFLTPKGVQHISGPVRTSTSQIRGSYFGMVQGRWPIHLLRNEPLPELAFRGRDNVPCKVRLLEGHTWVFEPLNTEVGSPQWFTLEFSLPWQIASLVEEEGDDRVGMANIKQEHFSYIDITGLIGDVRRNIRLQLDRDWIRDYVERENGRRKRHSQHMNLKSLIG
jgi:hypothetical protein